MSKMKNIDKNSVSLYLNLGLTFTMLGLMVVKGESLDVFTSFDVIDWSLMTFFAVATVIVQTLKF